MHILPVSLLRLVDDIIGVTDAGYRAQQMNDLLNVKTANKRLQFGIDKGKSMLVCKKKPEHVLNSHLLVDNWKVKHKDNEITGESDLIRSISCKGDNMVNIGAMKNKSIWMTRKIFSPSINLQKYYLNVP
jgi:hypothetical protein